MITLHEVLRPLFILCIRRFPLSMVVLAAAPVMVALLLVTPAMPASGQEEGTQPASKEANVTKEPSKFKFEYAVKVLCTAHLPGTSQTSALGLQGTYQTVVNIHNPNDHRIKFRKKIAVPSVITDYLPGSLGPDEVSRVICHEMGQNFGIGFIHGVEGYLVVQSTDRLDVTAVYTAGDKGVRSIDIEYIPERQMGNY